jgi:hypothetical protein
MNAIAANELKRNDITAIEKLLTKGPVHGNGNLIMISIQALQA